MLRPSDGVFASQFDRLGAVGPDPLAVDLAGAVEQRVAEDSHGRGVQQVGFRLVAHGGMLPRRRAPPSCADCVGTETMHWQHVIRMVYYLL